MHRYLFLFLIALHASSFPKFARGGDSVNNGGGGVEQMLLYTWANLNDFLAPCLSAESCFRSGEGRAMLLAIQSAQEIEKGKLPRLVIHPKDPQIIHTGSTVGSPITLNLAPLYAVEPSLSLGASLELLLEALALHHPALATPRFAHTLEGMRTLWEARAEMRDLRKIGHAEISLMAVARENQSLLVGTGAAYINISPALEKQIPCGEGRVSNAVFRNFFWDEPEAAGAKSVLLPLFGRVAFRCGETQLSGRFRLIFPAEVLKGSAEEFLKKPGDFGLKLQAEQPRLSLYDIH
jgi:hypothetical protein